VIRPIRRLVEIGLKGEAVSDKVTPDFLLRGCALALEQCGLLLRDACELYERKSFATALVLTFFAREELGRSQILLGFWRRAVGGESLTVEQIKAACDKHVDKQRAGMLSTVMRGTRETRLGQLLWEVAKSPLQSEKWNDARAALDQVNKKLLKSTPDDRHKARMASLYVEPQSSTEWNRPADKSAKEAYEDLVDAVNDYRGRSQHWHVGSPANILQHTDPVLYRAIKQMSHRPSLPTPIDPSWPD
jgi:AbiV family abortive infection protein